MAESALDADTQAYLTESLCGGDDDAWEETLSSFLPDEADAPVIAKLTAAMREAVPADTSQPQAPGKVQLAAPVTLSDDLLVEGTSGASAPTPSRSAAVQTRSPAITSAKAGTYLSRRSKRPASAVRTWPDTTPATRVRSISAAIPLFASPVAQG